MVYLFLAFLIVWMGLFLYFYKLTSRISRIEKELDSLIRRKMGD
jgi:CcmD family protein